MNDVGLVSSVPRKFFSDFDPPGLRDFTFTKPFLGLPSASTDLNTFLLAAPSNPSLLQQNTTLLTTFLNTTFLNISFYLPSFSLRNNFSPLTNATTFFFSLLSPLTNATTSFFSLLFSLNTKFWKLNKSVGIFLKEGAEVLERADCPGGC